MPYVARPAGDNRGPDSEWEVVNTETNEVKAVHEPPDAKEKAEAQVRLLHEIEQDPEWEQDGGDHHASE